MARRAERVGVDYGESRTRIPKSTGWRPQLPERGGYEAPKQPERQPNFYERYRQSLLEGLSSGRTDWNQLGGVTAGLTPRDVRQYRQEQRDQEKMQSAMDRDRPPANPAEALRYQFYGAEDAARRQEEMFGQAMEAYSQAQEGSRQAHAESQMRNEQLMREGLARQQQEEQIVRQRNEEMMRQQQATLQHMFGLLRQGGEGSLAAFMSPMGSELGRTWMAGRWDPMQSGQYFQGMMGTPDPSHQYMGRMGDVAAQTQFAQPDYTAWMDPAAHRSSWYLPAPTMQRQTIPTAPSGVPGPGGTTGQYPWQQQPDVWANLLQGLYGGME